MNAAEFKQQFLPYSKRLYRIAFRMMGNEQDAEDMVQDTFLKLWKKRDDLPELENVEAYCTTLLKNTCYDAIRVRKPDADSPPEELNVMEERSTSDVVEQRDEVNTVKRLIEMLPDLQRQIIQMKDVEDYSYEEIEERTGLTMVNIRVTLSRARKKIREQFMQIRNYGNR